MDDIYSELDNYNDENTIAELQAENKGLKEKLEEHATALAKLQEDFDKLSSEYKKLELNYSSLLKTAKSEIQRKTEIINKLNVEKDQMVLKTLQNRNGRRINISPHNNQVNKNVEQRNLTPVTKDRPEQNQLPLITIPNSELRNKLLSLSKTNTDTDPRINRTDTKEDVLLSKTDNDSIKARASIKNRRKSMPAVRPEPERFSSDDDNLSHKRNLRENLSRGSSRESRPRIQNNYSETRNSRTSDRSGRSPSLEDRLSGYNERTLTSRQSRGDRESTRIRSKSTHRNRRYSPERQLRGSGSLDPRYSYPDERRYNYDKHRLPERPNYRLDRRRSRERFREECVRRHSQERPHQERHPMKHKIEHNPDITDNKRMKLDPHYRPFEEDQGLRNEKDFSENRHMFQPNDNFQFSSCESPDYDESDPNHILKEIRFTATTELDDPRLTQGRYVLQKDCDGKTVLSTNTDREINLIPVDIEKWNLPVKMPDALLHRPPSVHDQNTNLVAESPPSNISMESGEIRDNVKENVQQAPRQKIEIGNEIKPKIPTALPDITKDYCSYKKLGEYKIPKQSKAVSESSCSKTDQERVLGKLIQESSSKKTKRKKSVDEREINRLMSKQEKVLDKVPVQRNTEFSLNPEKHERQHVTNMKVVQDDLELSDDTCDDSHEQTKVPVSIESAEIKREVNRDQIHTNKSNNYIKTVEDNPESKPIKLTIHLNKDTATEDGKRKKNKKAKHKEHRDDTVKCSAEIEKHSKKRSKEKETKPKEIKTKFSELFGDSSSLITPEDLGLAGAPAATTGLPGDCASFFEDAQDAIHIEPKALTPDKTLQEDSKQKDDSAHIVNVNTGPVEKKNGLKPTIVEETSEIYKNLEPSIPDKEDAVNTVIISSGVQPQILNEPEKREVPKIDEAKRVSDVSLKALATSTPYKCESLPQIDTKLSESDTGSKVLEAAILDNSESNTVESQTKDGDAPDVRIFMKRRRRVIKK